MQAEAHYSDGMSRYGSLFSLPFEQQIAARGKRIIAAIALAAALQGCVAAALPVLAGGAIVGTEASRNKGKANNSAASEATISEAAAAEAGTNAATKAEPANPEEDAEAEQYTQLSMAELARQDIAKAQNANIAELPPVGGDTIENSENSQSSDDTALASGEATAANSQSVAIDPARFAPMSVYVLEVLAKDAPSQGRMSAILAEPSSLKPTRLPCGRSKLAVLVDLDPKGGLHDPAAIAPTYDGDVLGHLSRLRDAGVKIGWISALTAADAGAVRKGLRVSGLDVKGEDELVLLRYPGDRKQTRRAEFGAAHCLIALAGDERVDFDELYDYLLRPSSAATLEPMIGKGWFLLPALK